MEEVLFMVFRIAWIARMSRTATDRDRREGETKEGASNGANADCSI
jgi:hypothetical protein